jgi:hypothetical protein
VSYPRGFYFTDEENSTSFEPGVDITEESIATGTAGVYTLDQNSIDAGLYAILTAFSDVFKRGIYSYDGTNFNLELDLTDFSYVISLLETENADLSSRVAALEAWQQEAEAAAAAANGGA